MGQCISKGPAAAARGDSLSISSSFGGEEGCSLHSAQGPSEVIDEKDKIFQSTSTKKKVRGEYRPILIKYQESSSPQPSSTSKGRRVQFFISPSKSDMKKSDIKPKKVAPEVSVEYKLESERIRKNSPKKVKKSSSSSSSKKQSIVEPLIENKSPPSKPLRIFTHTPSTSSCSPTCQRKPLLPINSKQSTQNITTTDEITDKRKFINVSKLPLFKFAKSNNSKNKKVFKKNVEDTTSTTTTFTNTHAHTASEITLKESSKHNLTGTTTINRTINTTLNGNDIISKFVDPTTTTTTTTTMGVNFSDDTTKTTTLPQHLLELGHAERDNTNCNNQNTSAIFKTQKNILQESINSSSLTKSNYSTTAATTNNNHFSSNLNDVTNIYSQHLSSTPNQISTSIKSAEKIIAENRLRRNLFFGSPDIQTDYTNSNININNYTVDNMNGYPKKSIFKKPHDMKQKSKQQQQQQEATIPVPKLYSLNHSNGITTVSNTMKGDGLKMAEKSQSTTIAPISKLPTYSGAYNNNSRLPNPCASTTTKTSSSTIPPSSLFNSRIQNVLPNNNKTQQIRGSQNQIDLPQTDPKVSQWISANDFFKQNPISKQSSSVGFKSQQQQQVENRRETLPSRFGYVGSTSTQRKKLNDVQSSNELLDRRASAYTTTTTTTNLGRKIPISASGLKKPIQSKPFYEIMMHRNVQPLSSTINNTNKNPSSTFGSARIFQGVSTGRVKQAACNIEKKINESVAVTYQNNPGESVHHNTSITSNTSSNSPQSSNNSLLRSNTWVKSSPSVYIPTDDIIDTTTTTENLDESFTDRTIIQNSSDSTTTTKGIYTNKISSNSKLQQQHQRQQLNLSTEQSRNSCQSKPPRLSLDGFASQKREEDLEDTSHNLSSQSYKIIEARKELFLPYETNNSNYPLTTSSTSSSVISSEEPTSMSSSHIPGIGGGGTDNDKAISELGELIDDEIEDQPDLTLTFKDSSLILSPSSSGESLVSCDLMLDYKDSTCSGFANSGDSALLDLDEPSTVMPPNRSKSVISSIVSTDVLCTSSGVPQRIMVNSRTRRSSNQGVVGDRNGRISPVATSTPVNISNNNNKLSSGLTLNKISQNSYISQRDKTTTNLQQIQNSNTVSRQQTSQSSLQSNRHSGSRGKLTSIPSPIYSHHDISSSSSSSLSSSKMSTSSETPIVPSSIPTKIKAQNLSNTNSSSNNNNNINNNNNNNNSNTIKSPYRYPRNSSPARIPTLSTSPNKTTGIIRKSNNNSNNNEVNDTTTTTKVINTASEGENFVSDSFVKEILTEVLECKTQLEELKSALETTEKEVLDKNEIIERQKKEIEYWKNTALSTNIHKSSSHNIDEDGDNWGKEKGLINMVKETANACSQTENTYQPKPAVSYPDENDKMGQLVSFRIGRMSSNTSNKN